MRGPSATTRRKARRASQATAGERRRCLTEQAAQRRREGEASKGSGVAKRPNTGMCEFGAGLRLPRSAADRCGRSRTDVRPARGVLGPFPPVKRTKSEEHTSELQSLMRISYAVFCLKKKNATKLTHHKYTYNNNN